MTFSVTYSLTCSNKIFCQSFLPGFAFTKMRPTNESLILRHDAQCFSLGFRRPNILSINLSCHVQLINMFKNLLLVF